MRTKRFITKGGTPGAAAAGRLGGAILAGGKATRLGGAAKGLLQVGGCECERNKGFSIIEKLIQALLQAGVEEVVILANDRRMYGSFGCEVVPDLRPGLGPLGGIEAALAYFAGRLDATVVLPCDVPGISAKEVKALTTAYAQGLERVVFARTGSSFCHPLCAVVHNGILSELSAAIDRGQRTVRDFWSTVGSAEAPFADANVFANINTPSDLQRWQSTTNI